MKSLTFNRYIITVFHLLFWIVSLNIFNAFFSRGVETGYVLEDFNLSIWNILLFSNIIIIFVAGPFIWLFKELKPWINQK